MRQEIEGMLLKRAFPGTLRWTSSLPKARAIFPSNRRDRIRMLGGSRSPIPAANSGDQSKIPCEQYFAQGA